MIAGRCKVIAARRDLIGPSTIVAESVASHADTDKALFNYYKKE